MMNAFVRLAVVGASTLVGQAILELLSEQQVISAAQLVVLDEARRAGNSVTFGPITLTSNSLEEANFEEVTVAVFAAGTAISRQYASAAYDSGAIVVDFSDAFRQDDQVPLIIPAVNGVSLSDDNLLIALPNCTVTPLAMALAPLCPFGIERVTVATYQSVSGTGQAAIEELASQTTALFSHQDTQVSCFDKRIAFNVLPQIGALDVGGVSREERSVVDELRRLLMLPGLAVEATCVRVPVFFGHAWAVVVALTQSMSSEAIEHAMQAAGLYITPPNQHGGYITPMEVTGNAAICVSRVRAVGEHAFAFWLVADNVKAGAAVNAVNVVKALLARERAA